MKNIAAAKNGMENKLYLINKDMKALTKEQIIKILADIFDNTKRIHPNSDWVTIAIYKSADYLTRKFSKPKANKKYYLKIQKVLMTYKN